MQRKLITDSELRLRCSKYVAAALDVFGGDKQKLARNASIPSAKYINDYLHGRWNPSTERLFNINHCSKVSPDDYGIPLFKATRYAERMRELFRQGHTVSEFEAALNPLDSSIIDKLLADVLPSALSLVKFSQLWEDNAVEALLKNPEFCIRLQRTEKAPVLRRDLEMNYIKRNWGACAETAREIKAGVWEWFTESMYRLELEQLEGCLYEFRGFNINTGNLVAKREVIIA